MARPSRIVDREQFEPLVVLMETAGNRLEVTATPATPLVRPGAVTARTSPTPLIATRGFGGGAALRSRGAAAAATAGTPPLTTLSTLTVWLRIAPPRGVISASGDLSHVAGTQRLVVFGFPGVVLLDRAFGWRGRIIRGDGLAGG